MWQRYVIIVLAYGLGSLSFSYWIVRWLKGIDVRTVGSGNAGATNVLRAAGKGPAVLTLLLDVAKGGLAVWVARFADLDSAWIGLAATAVVCGHVFPVFSGFRGGKGVATAIGALLVVSPVTGGAMLVVFVSVVGLTRYVSLGSILAALFFPVAYVGALRLGWLDVPGSEWLVIHSAVIALLIVIKHRSNIARLWQGRENKLGTESPAR